MLLSLVDILRCPAPHQESVLVLSVDAWRDQGVWTGTLGCPVCSARYEIRDGAVYFGTGGEKGPNDPRGPLDAMRLAAQLGLAEPGGVVLLTGRYADMHRALIDMAEVTCLLLDAAKAHAHLAVNLKGVSTLPLADGTVRGAAVDDDRAYPSFMTDVARCLRADGRLVAPATTPMPQGVTAVALDTEEWVAAAAVPLTTIPLTRRQQDRRVV